MKIALLGNMNNLNFCLMRYLRDLGMDAYLLMYKDELSVFLPECDTYELNKWQPYIITTPLANNSMASFLRISKKTIINSLQGYDFYIGNGLAPSYFDKAGIKLDLFIPYSVGVEKVMVKDLKLVWNHPRELIKSILIEVYRRPQLKGLKHSTKAAASMDVACINLFEDIGLPVIPYGVVPIYNAEKYTEVDKQLLPFIERMDNTGFVLYSHVSHNYKNVHPLYDIKKNYILIRGLAEYVERSGNRNVLLVFHAYGKDVKASRRLIRELGIEDLVLWLPHVKRKQIMKLLEHADMGGGEFGGVIWGSTGIEFMSRGIPFFQSVSFSEKEFADKYNIPMPPIINVDNPGAIADHIEEYHKDPEEYRKRGKTGLQWYNEYNGIALAKKYKDLILSMHSGFADNGELSLMKRETVKAVHHTNG